MRHFKGYMAHHPRPRFIRPAWQSLSGLWRFAFDDDHQGLDQAWHQGIPGETTIRVPFTYQTKASGIHDPTSHPVVWYQTTFEARTDLDALLHLEGSDFHTSVWLNGVHIHDEQGGYHRITMDISRHLKDKDNLLVLRIEDTVSTLQPRGKQRWKPESFGCWYVETTGLWKTVWLEYVHPYHVKDVVVQADAKKLMLALEAEVSKLSDDLWLETVIAFEDEKVHVSKIKILHATTRFNLDLRTQKDQFKIKRWSPSHPHLYDVTYRLYLNGQCIDEVHAYTAFRTWQRKGRGLYLNGSPVYLKMLLDQGYWPDSGLTPPDEQALQQDIEMTLAMGFNGIRKHQKIEDERFYYLCDVLGVNVWLEMPSSYEFSKSSLQMMTIEWLAIVKQYRHYASIMAYVLYNESWGVHEIAGNQEQQEATVALYHLTKALDPSRFVIANDGWEHTKTDLITIHNYVETGPKLTSIYQDMTGVLNPQAVTQGQTRCVFANGFGDEGQPIIISEYGGIAFSKDEGWGYGSKVSNEAAYLERLSGLTRAIKALPDVSGYCLTQTTDVEQETNGLLTPSRVPKVDMKTIKAINDEEVVT